jgi:hypothetical protein
MSVARGNQNGRFYYSNVTIPQEVNLSWTVAPADTGGLGITGLKSNGWAEYVFMHTSATPGVVGGVTNPNPANGVAAIRLKNNFNTFLNAECVPQATVTGSALTSVTQGTVYQITSLGTTTAAQWVAAGLPLGFTPTVGQTFVAAATASIGGTGTVKALTTAGFDHVEVCGNPTLTINSSNIASYAGLYLVVQFVLAGSLAAPTTGTVIDMKLLFDRSSVTIDGL